MWLRLRATGEANSRSTSRDSLEVLSQQVTVAIATVSCNGRSWDRESIRGLFATLRREGSSVSCPNSTWTANVKGEAGGKVWLSKSLSPQGPGHPPISREAYLGSLQTQSWNLGCITDPGTKWGWEKELRGNPDSAHALIWRAALGRGSRRRDKLWSSGKRSESGSPRAPCPLTASTSSQRSLEPVEPRVGRGKGRGELRSSTALKFNVTPPGFQIPSVGSRAAV